jgi:hypothetical protein
MHARWLVAVGVLAASIFACGYSVKAASNDEQQVNLSNYGTFFMLKGNSTGDSVRDERLTSDVKSALRAEVFNLTNTPPLGPPNGVAGTAAFGTITSAGDPRVLQLAVKMLF